MSFRPQSGGHRGVARHFSKSTPRKKSKEKKQRISGKYVEEQPETSVKEVAEKTLAALNRLGSQIFALSPFSQYYDDWLVNLRQTVSEFESSPFIAVDEQFVRERSQIFQDIEAALAEKRLEESNLTGAAKELAETNHLLVEADRTYAEQARVLSHKRNSDVQRLSSKIRELEESIASQEEAKFGVFQIRARKRASQKLEQTRKELVSAKSELEVALQSFTVEQEKLHDQYEAKKQELSDRSDRLHKELEKLEVDTSIEARKKACNSLVGAVNNLLKRTLKD